MEFNSQKHSFEVLRKMDFNSDRKRMSVLLKDPTDNQIKLLIKGADSIIKSRLDMDQYPKDMRERVEWFLNTASKQGLRTLLMGMRVVSPEELKEFQNKLQAVESDEANFDKMEQELEKVYSEFERGIVLLGGTAVEDKLQDDVP